MTSLYVDRRGADLELEGDTIVVRVDGKREGTAPLRAIERVVVRNGGRLATRLVSRLNDRKIGLVLLPGRSGEPAAILSPAEGDAALRLAQYALIGDPGRRDRLSCDLIRAKLAGQARLLRKADQNAPTKPLKDAIRRLDQASEGLASYAAVPARKSLRGIEGAASAAYFSGFISLFPKDLSFHNRNRRPPRDPVNVCLSLGYTLLHHEAVRALVGRGLDPTLGIYHDIRPARESLACDFAEPLRPAIDRFVLRLFQEDYLAAKQFTKRGSACRMGKEGRKQFYRTFEDTAPGLRRLLKQAVDGLVTEIQATPDATCRVGVA